MIQDKAYPDFSENQVLTHDHLNRAVRYLELEDRVSRLGSGIYCGFVVSYGTAGVDKVVRLSAGSGWTSKGYLIVNRLDRVYRFYQELVLPENSEANYLTVAGERLALYELLENDRDAKDPTKVNPLAKRVGNAHLGDPQGHELDVEGQMAVLLHLEIVSNDLTVCTIDSCDNEGLETQLRWRPVLIRKQALNRLLEQDLDVSGEIQAYFRAKYQVHEVRIARPQWNCPVTQSYPQIVLNYRYLCTVSMTQLLETFYRSKRAYGRSVADLEFELGSLHKNYRYYMSRPTVAGIQYFYDHLKDIAAALNEFDDAAFAYCCECSFNENRYARYLMAGSLGRATPDYTDDPYRHYFESCCPDLAGTNAKRRLRVLYERINDLLTGFRTDFIDGSRALDDSERLFITADSSASGQLADRALSYYYRTDVRRRWHPDRCLRAQSQDIAHYWQRQEPNAADWMQDANSSLRFRLDRHDGYHIEGHLGMSTEEFREAFYGRPGTVGMKERFGLPFDVKLLEARETEECRYRQPYAYLKELEILYDLEKREILCFLSNLFSFFGQFQSGGEAEPGSDGLVACQKRLRKYASILAKLERKLGREATLAEVTSRIPIDKVVCPENKTGEASFYLVEHADPDVEAEASRADIPVLIEYPGHHSRRRINVLYLDHHVDSIDVTGAAYGALLTAYVPHDDPKRAQLMAVPIVAEGEALMVGEAGSEAEILEEALEKIIALTDGEGGDIGAFMVDEGGYAKILQTIQALIEREEDAGNLAQLSAVLVALQAVRFDSASAAERAEFRYLTTIIEGEGVEVIRDQDNILAKGFLRKGNTTSVMNILAGKLHTLGQRFERDRIDIEDAANSPATLQREIESLRELVQELITLFAEHGGGGDGDFPYSQCVVLPLLTSISRLCWEKKFFEIKHQYNAKKGSLFRQILLPQYVEQHPGIEHRTSVPEDGTFLAVYVTQRQTLTAALSNRAVINKLRQVRARYRWALRAYLRLREETPDLNLVGMGSPFADWVERYESFIDELGRLKIDSTPLADSEIVADFCLPYLCCSEDSNVEYIVVAELEVNLPKRLCNHDEEHEIQYSPIGARISSPDDALAVIERNDRFFINPIGLEEGEYGLTITLGSKSATYTTRVLQHPSAGIEAADAAPTWNEEKQAYLWTFTADTNQEKWSYRWFLRHQLGGNREFVQVGNGVTYVHVSGEYEPLSLALHLKVANGPCVETSETLEAAFLPEFEWTLLPTSLCDDDEAKALSYVPPGAKLIGEDRLTDHLSGKPGVGYHLNAHGLAPDSYTIRMQLPPYDPRDVAIGVFRRPQGVFVKGDPVLMADGIHYRILLTAAEQDASYAWRWYLGDSPEQEPDGTDAQFELTWDRYQGFIDTIRLVVTNEPCGGTCRGESMQGLTHEADVPTLEGPAQVCNNVGDIELHYTPVDHGVHIGAEGGGTYVRHEADNGVAFLKTNDLSPGHYRIHLTLGDHDILHEVHVQATPAVPSYQTELASGTWPSPSVLSLHVVDPTDGFIYRWVISDSEDGLTNPVESEAFSVTLVGHLLEPREVFVQLRAVNRACADSVPAGRCDRATGFDRLVIPAAEPVEMTLECAETVCDNSGPHHIHYTPEALGASVHGTEDANYVLQQEDDGTALFKTKDLEPGTYTVFLALADRQISREVNVLATPVVPGYFGEVISGEDLEPNAMTLQVGDPSDELTYRWLISARSDGSVPITDEEGLSVTVQGHPRRERVFYVQLIAVNPDCAAKVAPGSCQTATERRRWVIEAPEPVELTLDVPSVICSNSGDHLIHYSPPELDAIVSGVEHPDSVDHHADNGTALFKSDGLAPGEYTVVLTLQEQSIEQEVKVLATPALPTYGHETIAGEGLSPHRMAFRVNDPSEDVIYRWLITEGPEGADELLTQTGESITVTGLMESDRLIFVQLTAVNPLCAELVPDGLCQTVIDRQPFTIQAPDPIEPTLDVPAVVCNNSGNHAIHYGPVGVLATLSVEGHPDRIIHHGDDGTALFKTDGLLPGAYTVKVTVGAFSTPAVIRVMETPTVPTYEFDRVEGEPLSPNSITFRVNEALAGLTYQWLISNDPNGTDVIFDGTDLSVTRFGEMEQERVIYVQLRATGVACTAMLPAGSCQAQSIREAFRIAPPAPVHLALEVPNFLCHSSGDHTIRYTPENIGATLSVVGQPGAVVQNDVAGTAVLKTADLSPGAYTLVLALGDLRDEAVITLLERPAAPAFAAVPVAGDGSAANTMTFRVNEPRTDITYRWRISEGTGEPTEAEGQEVTIVGDPHADRELNVQLTAVNPACAELVPTGLCEATMREGPFLIEAPEPVNPSLTVPNFVCDNSGDHEIVYTPADRGASVQALNDAGFVHQGPDDGKAVFKSNGLSPGNYTVVLTLADQRRAGIVRVLETPAVPGIGNRRGLNSVTVFIEGTADLERLSYLWLVRDDDRQPKFKVEGQGRTVTVYGYAYSLRTVEIKLAVINKFCADKVGSCRSESPIGSFVIKASGNWETAGPASGIDTDGVSSALLETPGGIVFANHVRVIDKRLRGIRVDSEETGVEAGNPLDDSGATIRLMTYTGDLSDMIDTVIERGGTPEQQEPAKRYIKAHLITLSKLLLARTKDLGTSTRTYKDLQVLLGKANTLYAPASDVTADREIVGRSAGKKNISTFVFFVGKI